MVLNAPVIKYIKKLLLGLQNNLKEMQKFILITLKFHTMSVILVLGNIEMSNIAVIFYYGNSISAFELL